MPMIRKRDTRKISLFFFFLTAFALLSIAACSSNTVQSPQNQNLKTVRSPVATKIVNDAFGQVEIPLHPQRVVVLDDSVFLDPVLALGIKPVGATSCRRCIDTFRGIPSDLVTDIQDVGDFRQPSLEKVLSLKPDLILSYPNSQSYAQLSAIAPTVAIKYEDLLDFKARLRHFAQILGKSDRAEEVLAQYEARIQQLRQRLGTEPETKTVATIYYYLGTQISVFRPDVFTHSQVLNDVGFQFIQPQNDQKEESLLLSIEVLPEYDADFLFVITSTVKDAERIKSLSFLKQSIWSTLKAVQNQHVYSVNWDVGGPIGANRVIDDLYKYLVNTP